MSSQRPLSRASGTRNSTERQQRFARDLHRSRKSLISTFLESPPACREFILNDEASALRRSTHWSYERIESCFAQLEAFQKSSRNAEVTRFLEQARLFRTRMNRAREALITENLGLVPLVVQEFSKGTIPLSDLIQEGYIGLLWAADRYDPHRGARFSTYARWWILRALSEAFTERARLIRLPDSIRRELRTLRAAAHELTSQLDRTPTDLEIVGRTGLSIKKIKKLRAVAPDPDALEDVASEHAEGWQAVVGATEAPGPFEAALRGEIETYTSKALAQLDPREREIIKLRYGFVDGDEFTLQQIGAVLGLSRERFRQIEAMAMEKISRWLKRAHVAAC